MLLYALLVPIDRPVYIFRASNRYEGARDHSFQIFFLLFWGSPV